MLFGELTPATFHSRPNRFLGVVEVSGEYVECFVPNPGRMEELLFKGARVHLRRVGDRNRKTRYDLALVDLNGVLVSVDSRVPNIVVAEAVEAGLIPEFRDLHVEHREPRYGDSRLDLLLSGPEGRLILEVKGCTLVEGRTALFPDAPTSRGARHLRTLTLARAKGRSAIVFVIQRGDADHLKPNEATDPMFAAALREASLKGVETYAYASNVTLEGISINRRVPVKI